MSNILYITVGEFRPLNQHESDNVIVLASDQYATEALTFDDIEHLKLCYPTKEDLTVGVLALPAFEGAAIFNDDGTYEFDTVSSVILEGYPE